jgi:hypothetical protein
MVRKRLYDFKILIKGKVRKMSRFDDSTMMWVNDDISDLLDKTMAGIEQSDNDEIIFTDIEGNRWKMYHDQDCCEDVRIDDIIGDFEDIIGHPLLVAECRTNSNEDENFNSETWTFYELATIKGSVTIRWYGTSNGYYSESVDFEKIESVENFLKNN